MIGIIGGAGVAAGAALVARIEEIVTASGAYLDQQHPEVILYQATKAPSRSMYLEGRGGSFVPAYIEAIQKLDDFGATCIAMCCNTAHAALAELQAQSGIPIINLIDETLAMLACNYPDAKQVGILCSDGTRAGRLYDAQIRHRGEAIELIYPDEPHQSMVTQGIRNIKRGLHRGPASSERPQELFAAAAESLARSGATAILLACTEIPLALSRQVWSGPPLVDTIDVLARACLRHEMPES